MRKKSGSIAVAMFFGVLAASPLAQEARRQTPPPPPPAKHVMHNAADLKWGPAPPGLPPGAQTAVVEGDPAVKGRPFVIRAKMSDGYRVPPHWHPTDENVTVLSGTLMAGTGDKFDQASMTALTAGGFSNMKANLRHYVQAKGETVIQVHGVGPFAITYVNPADDPRKKTEAK